MSLLFKIKVFWVFWSNTEFCLNNGISKKDVERDLIDGWEYPHTMCSNPDHRRMNGQPVHYWRYKRTPRFLFGSRRIMKTEYHPDDEGPHIRENARIQKIHRDFFAKYGNKGSGGNVYSNERRKSGGSSGNSSNSSSVCNHMGTGV